MDWSGLQLSVATCYAGRPSASGDGVETATAFHSTWYVTAGRAEVRQAGRSWMAGPGECLVMPVYWRRLQLFSSDARIVSLGLAVTWPNGQPLLEQAAPIRFSDPALQDLATGIVLARTGDAVAWLRSRSAWYGYVAAWLERMLAAGARLRPAGSGDARLDRARDLLCVQPDLGALPYAELQRITGWSRTQIDRRFREMLGCTPRQVRDRAALARVRALLADPGRKLSAIASEMQATDASHLVKWFHRQTGRTPGEERRLGPAD